ncbi:uncharacterized protein MELLADRAFT_71396 [Melampsora larici-populina 98AG31]|uniref:Secreted protein n=1 Tax=Melampsora larici-populina (strain 98AG31 / pathotype 3-4-7) TaxID=747676 RepID=F4RGA3_MELLP|nr:uncharacterized protein MELLADRAFT_71396 [Melampsora larici-populina 98AG31]EGG08699.1 secreted protein [Melampsora larici-populina 98AG31]
MRFHNRDLMLLSLFLIALAHTVCARELECWRFTDLDGKVAACENPYHKISTICPISSCTITSIPLGRCSRPGEQPVIVKHCYAYGPSPTNANTIGQWESAVIECKSRSESVPYTCQVSLKTLPKIRCSRCHGW